MCDLEKAIIDLYPGIDVDGDIIYIVDETGMPQPYYVNLFVMSQPIRIDLTEETTE